jgi:hypothetical protein
MNQKRFLTLLPLIFLFITTLLFLGLYLLNVSSNGCSEDETFRDEGMNITFKYPCSWELSFNTQFTKEFASTESNTDFGPVAKKYDIILKKDNAEIKISNVLIATEGTSRALDDRYDYKKLNDKIVRFQREDSEEIRYSEYVTCDKLPAVLLDNPDNSTDCARSFINTLGTQFPVLITATNGKLEIEEIDDVVEKVVE